MKLSKDSKKDTGRYVGKNWLMGTRAPQLSTYHKTSFFHANKHTNGKHNRVHSLDPNVIYNNSLTFSNELQPMIVNSHIGAHNPY